MTKIAIEEKGEVGGGGANKNRKKDLKHKDNC
jgi:hypothetical protein